MSQEYFSKGDLGRRWGISVQNVGHWEKRHPPFIPESFRVGKGRIPIYHIHDILAYEARRNIKPKRED